MTEALSSLSKRETASFSIQGISQKLGVTHAAAYRHFADKRDLLAAIAVEGVAHFVRSVEDIRARLESLDRSADPWPLFREGVARFVQFSFENAGYFRAIFHADLEDDREYPELLAARQERFAAMSSLILRCVGGDLPQSELRSKAIAFWAVTYGLSMLFIEEQLPGTIEMPRFDPLQTAQEVARVLENGMKSVAA